MKFKKLITLASLVGLITFLLPVVSSGNQSVAPVSEHVVDYLNAPSLLMLLLFGTVHLQSFYYYLYL